MLCHTAHVAQIDLRIITNDALLCLNPSSQLKT